MKKRAKVTLEFDFDDTGTAPVAQWSWVDILRGLPSKALRDPGKVEVLVHSVVDATPALGEALARLGRMTPAEIAQTLRKAGVKGTGRSAKTCPIAQYLTGELGMRVSVGLETASIPSAFDGYSTVHADLPPSVKDFVLITDILTDMSS